MKALNHIPKNLLVVRADRIGDLVLSTPVFQALKENFPNTQVTALVSEYASDVVKNSPYLDAVIEFDTKHRFRGLSGARKMGLLLASKEFDTALVLQTNLSVAIAVLTAGIQYRIGPKTRPHSYLAYNYGISQHRSRVEMHESEYNLQMLKIFGIDPFTKTYATHFGTPTERQTLWVEKFLAENRQYPERPLIAIHPGMGLSALNWPIDYYAELVRSLAQLNQVEILLTGSASEDKLHKEIQKRSGVLNILRYQGQEGVGALFELTKRCHVFVAPSTGPLHIATAAQIPVIGIYPPIKVQSALRWGPYGAKEGSQIITPEVNCGEIFSCAGERCPYYFCMRNIYPSEVLEKITQLLK